MGGESSKALKSGSITSQDMAEHWAKFTNEDSIPRAKAFEFLTLIASERGITLKAGELTELVDKCTDISGSFLFADLVVLFSQFAKEHRLKMTSSLKTEITAAKKREKTPRRNFLINKPDPSHRISDCDDLIKELAKTSTLDSYLKLLPRDLLRMVWQSVEVPNIFYGPSFLNKVHCIGNLSVSARNHVIHNHHIIALVRSREKSSTVFSPEAYSLGTGECVWRGASISGPISTDTSACVTTNGYYFISVHQRAIHVYNPPLRNAQIVTILNPGRQVLLASLGDKVYFLSPRDFVLNFFVLRLHDGNWHYSQIAQINFNSWEVVRDFSIVPHERGPYAFFFTHRDIHTKLLPQLQPDPAVKVHCKYHITKCKEKRAIIAGERLLAAKGRHHIHIFNLLDGTRVKKLRVMPAANIYYRDLLISFGRISATVVGALCIGHITRFLTYDITNDLAIAYDLMPHVQGPLLSAPSWFLAGDLLMFELEGVLYWYSLSTLAATRRPRYLLPKRARRAQKVAVLYGETLVLGDSSAGEISFWQDDSMKRT